MMLILAAWWRRQLIMFTWSKMLIRREEGIQKSADLQILISKIFSLIYLTKLFLLSSSVFSLTHDSSVFHCAQSPVITVKRLKKKKRKKTSFGFGIIHFCLQDLNSCHILDAALQFGLLPLSVCDTDKVMQTHTDAGRVSHAHIVHWQWLYLSCLKDFATVVSASLFA